MTNAILVEETLQKIQSSEGVIGLVILNVAGIPIRSSFDNATSVQYAGLIQQLIGESKKVIKKEDSTDDLMFLRLRTRKYEILIIPDKQYTMIVVHNPTGGRPPI